MALFQMRWLRRLIRKYTNPIPEDKAEFMKKRLALAYMLLGWNAFGFVCYMVFTGRADWAKFYGYKSEEEAKMPPGQQWCKTLGIEKAKVIRISGFRKQHEYLVEDGEIVATEKENEIS